MRGNVTALIGRHGKPGLIVSDHWSEFTSNAMLAWSEEAGVPWHFIASGKPMQNGISEACNSKMRQELMNETLFFGLDHARSVIAAWVADYNAARPERHSDTSPPRLMPPNAPQWAISSTNRKCSPDRPLLPPRKRVIVKRRSWFQLDESLGSLQNGPVCGDEITSPMALEERATTRVSQRQSHPHLKYDMNAVLCSSR